MRQVFICDICGSNFDNKQDALVCEQSHWHTVETIDFDLIKEEGYNEDLDSIQTIKIPVRRRSLIDGKQEQAILVLEASYIQEVIKK